MTRLEEVQYLRTEPGGRHYNCAQSLLVPFAPLVGLDREQADALEGLSRAYDETDPARVEAPMPIPEGE